MPPRYVSLPVVTTTAVAEPLSTLVPRNAMLVSSRVAVLAGSLPLCNFSTGKLSPVSDPWMMNRSFAATIRTSPGIMSPAASLTTSPGTSPETAISWGVPSRKAVAVTEIIALSLAAALSAFASWMSLRLTPRAIIRHMTIPARESPVAKEIVASAASRRTSGLSTACQSSLPIPTRWFFARTLGPCSARSAADSTTSGETRIGEDRRCLYEGSVLGRTAFEGLATLTPSRRGVHPMATEHPDGEDRRGSHSADRGEGGRRGEQSEGRPAHAQHGVAIRLTSGVASGSGRGAGAPGILRRLRRRALGRSGGSRRRTGGGERRG